MCMCSMFQWRSSSGGGVVERERERLKPDEVWISVCETDISKNLIITMKIKAP